MDCKCGLPGRFDGSCVFHCDISKVPSSTLLNYAGAAASMCNGLSEFIAECEGFGGADPEHRTELRRQRRRLERFEKELRSRPHWKDRDCDEL